MRPRLGLSIALSMAILGAAVGAAAQQQQQRPRPAAAQPPAKPAQPSLFDKLTGMLNNRPKPMQPQGGDPNAPQALPVNWAAAGRYAQASKGGRAAPFIARNRPAIDSLSVPVLLPGDPDLLANMRIFPHGDFYTVSSTSNGMSFVLMGHSKAYALPPGTAKGLGPGGLAARVPADGIVIEASGETMEASFTRYGAAYSISLECRMRGADPRCASDAYVRGVITRMVTVMPAGRS